MTKEYFTTGEVARICGISHRTVVNYCNSGRIRAEQSPITHYRRIPRRELVRFMLRNGLSLELIEKFESESAEKPSHVAQE